MTSVIVKPGPGFPTALTVAVRQQSAPSVGPPDVGLVEIQTSAKLIPGPPGPPGLMGPVGPTGAVGPPNILNIGTVTTVSPGGAATADITGTSPAQILNLGIPQGLQGVQGIQGIQGPVGPAGTTDWSGITGKPSTFPPSPHTHPQSEIINLVDTLALKAPLADPTFTGSVVVPTYAPPTASGMVASTAFVANAISTFGTTQDARDDAQDTAIATKLGDAPNDGNQYVRQSLAWAPVEVPPGTIMQDTPPSSPDPGQFWYDTDSGGLYLWFNDGSSSQWIQVNGTGLTGNPAKQTFTAVIGSQSLNIPVPPGAKMCRLTGRMFMQTTATTLAAALRMSLDGSTFYSGASDYVYAGQAFYNGSAGSPVKIGTTSAAFIMLVQYTDSQWAPLFFDAVVGLVKLPTTAQYFTCHSRGWSFHSAATAGNQENLYTGYTGNTAFNTASEIKALQIVHAGFTGTFGANSFVTAEWSY